MKTLSTYVPPRSTHPARIHTLTPTSMPEISRFLGIVITMYYRDHPPPHFHAIYGEFEATVEIESGMIDGELPRRVLEHVQEWRSLHFQELADIWNLAKAGKPLPRIGALE